MHANPLCRYICVAKSLLIKDICVAIKKAYPTSSFKPPFLTVPKWLLRVVGPAVGLSRDMVAHAVGYCPQFDHSKIEKELGFKFVDPDVSIADQVKAMAALGICKEPK